MISPRERPIFYNDLKSLSPPKKRRSPLLPRIGTAIGIGAVALFLLGNIDRQSAESEPAPKIAVQSLEEKGVPMAAAGITASSAVEEASPPAAPEKQATGGKAEADYKAVDAPVSSAPSPGAEVVAGVSLDLQPRLEPLQPRQASMVVAKAPAEPPAPKATAAPEWESYTIRKGDTLGSIFVRAGLPRAEATAVSKAARKYRFDRKLHVGKSLSLLKNRNGGLEKLKYELDDRGSLSVNRAEGGYRARYLKYDVETGERAVEGTVRGSFGAAAKKAGLSRSMVRELVAIFRDRINLPRSLRKGDSFIVIYREERARGKKIKDGPILAAEIDHLGKQYRAIRYRDRSGYVSYYTPEGENLKQGFLRTPLRGGRITSRYGIRLHPISKRWKKHTGVDYSAKMRTPVMATGDGVVKYAKRDGGCGKTIVIEHSAKYSTLYAHLDGYKRGIRAGTRVKKGQVIGYLGNTGISTGPHLHYEFQVSGEPKDPLKVKLPESLPIAAAYRRDFVARARVWKQRLASVAKSGAIQLARNGPGARQSPPL